MSRRLMLTLCLLLLSTAVATAQPPKTAKAAKAPAAAAAAAAAAVPAPAPGAEAAAAPTAEAEAKMLGGISILGNDEAPKSLFIVPWKSSELGVASSLDRTLTEDDRPVDREVFARELAFYQVSASSKSPAPAAPVLPQISQAY